MDETYSWQGGTATAFDMAANWFDLTAGTTAASPPGAGDTAVLSGSGTIDGTASGLAALIVSTTTASGYALGATLDASAVDVGGFLALTDESYVTTDNLDVDGGTLDMQSGSAMTTGDEALQISVSGPAGGSGPSLLRLDNGAAIYTAGGSVAVGSGAGQVGTLLVAGGSLGCDLGGQLAVGAQGAAGSVAVTNGGDVTVYGGVVLGASGRGVLTLGSGAQLEADSFQGGPALDLGATASGLSSAGQGTLVSLGATIVVSSDALVGDTGQGSMAVGGGTLSTDGVTLGVGQSGAGTLSVGANETWTDTGEVVVGQSGSGTLLMTAYTAGSGSVTLGALSLGSAGGSGSVAISHETLSMQGVTILEGDGARGGTAANGITVGAGGVWDGAGQSVFLEQVSAGVANSLSVSGAGAVFDAATLFGFAGSRIAFVAGAHASLGTDPSTDTFGSAGGTITVAGAALSVGALMGVRSAGTLSMSGASSLSASAGLLVFDPLSTVALAGGVATIAGRSGTAVQISDGGTLAVAGAVLNAAGAVLIGDAPGSSDLSLVSVTGSASHVSIAGTLAVAPEGRGEFAVSSGGSVSAGSVSVGGSGAVHGSLVLAGSGDVLNTGLLSIGSAGTVTLGLGSHLSAGGLLLGTAAQGGTPATSGSLAIAGGKMSVFGGASMHGTIVLSLGGTLAVSNGATLAAGSIIIGQGTVSANSIVDLGRIGCNTGTMTCLGPVGGTGLLSVAGGGDMILQAGEASTVGLVFGLNGTFTASGVGLISGTITGWTTGDALDFTGVHVASDSFSGHVLTLFDGAGHVLGHETFAGNFTSSNFSLSADHGAGSLLSFHV